MDEGAVGGPGEAHPLMIMCQECGAVFSPGITLGPGTTFRGRGNRAACPSCHSIVDIPDGEYGVIDGAVRWLSQFRSPEERAHLAEVLQDAGQRLSAGARPEAVAEEIERATGLRVWDFLVGSKGAALAGWIGVVLALLTYLNQPDPPATPTQPPAVHVTVNEVPPALSVQDDPGQGNAGSGQRQQPGSLPTSSGRDIGGQHVDPAAGHQGKG